jgi:hypothetical protein
VEAGLPGNDTGDAAVIVPDTPCPLNENVINTFMEFVTQLPKHDPWNTEHFRNGLRVLESLLSNE